MLVQLFALILVISAKAKVPAQVGTTHFNVNFAYKQAAKHSQKSAQEH
jgi:hypothetical protein